MSPKSPEYMTNASDDELTAEQKKNADAYARRALSPEAQVAATAVSEGRGAESTKLEREAVEALGGMREDTEEAGWEEVTSIRDALNMEFGEGPENPRSSDVKLIEAARNSGDAKRVAQIKKEFVDRLRLQKQMLTTAGSEDDDLFQAIDDGIAELEKLA
jgi:hypothetical protein